MPRRYNTQKALPPLQVVVASSQPTTPRSPELRPWTDGKRLHSLQQASEILTAELGDNYSVRKLRDRIKSGILGRAGEIWLHDGSYKINIPAFLDWRWQNPDESALR